LRPSPGSVIKDPVLLRGCFRIHLLYDVAEAFDQRKLAALLGPHAGPVRHVFPRRTPEYVRFEQAPIVELGEPLTLPTGEQVACSLKYYAFAVVVVQIEVSFDCDWNALLAQASRWIDDDGVKSVGRQIAQRHLDLVSPAVIRPTQDWLHEEYLVVEVREILSPDGDAPVASDLLANHGQQITQVIRGEVAPLAAKVSDEIMESSISYYPSDLIVIGAAAAFVYDAADAAAAVQVLEYAKMQLLETRYYDGLMTRLLSEVYDALEEKRNLLLRRWTIPRDAKRFNTIRLDVMELTERIDNAIKFVSDAYYARVYRLAASRIGLPEYRNLVDEKLRTVGELYDFMIDDFNEARSFVLEVAVAILALLDVIFLLRGK
jgi:hypothetical protein